MDFDQEYNFIDEKIAGFEDDTQGTHHNIPDVSLIDQIVFGENNQDDEYVLEDIENQQGIEFSNGTEEVFVNDLESAEHHQSNSMNGIETEYHKIEYATAPEEVFIDDFEFTDHHQRNISDRNDIEEYQEIEYVTVQEEVPMDDLEFTEHHQRNNFNKIDIDPQQFIIIPWNHYYTPRELFLQREANNKEKLIANLEKQVSKLNKVVEKFQCQSRKDGAMLRQPKHRHPYRLTPGSSDHQEFSPPRDIQDHFETLDTHVISVFISFDEALQIWKDFNRRFPVPRDVSHLNLHLYLFDPNSKQDAPQTKRKLTNGYQLRRSFTGEHRGQTLSEKRKWDDYCRKLSYLQNKQEEAGLIRSLTASEEETERKWKNAVKRAHLGF